MTAKFDPNGAVEIIKDRFYFVTLRGMPKNDAHNLYFSIDNELIYEPFFADFGPLNLGHMHSYCMFLEEKLRDEKHLNKKIFHYSSYDAAKRTNAVYLICAYSVLFLSCTPEEALRPFVGIHPPLLQYRDPSVGPSTFGLPVLECIRGLVKARSCGFFDVRTFNVNEYHFYEKIENGDMNWIVPGKFLAFSGPHASHHNETGVRTPVPEDYIPYFKKHGVNTVVRLNKKLYERRRFTEYGVKHVDMYFIDGSCPSDAIMLKFLDLVESEPGAIAVHCKAGLGRTGTLIGSSLIKHYKFTAYEAIAWLRICRPGSVIGPQQHFLVQMQSSLWRSGDLYKRKLVENSSAVANGADLTSLHSSTSSSASSYNGDYITASHSEVPTKGAKSGVSKGASSKAATPSLSSASISVHMGTSGGDSDSSYPDSNSHTYSSGASPSHKDSGKSNILSKERLKADMRVITATLKSIRTSSSSATTSPSTSLASSTSSLTTSPHPPPTLYTSASSSSSSLSSAMHTPTHTSSYVSHSTPSYSSPSVISSPYTPQASSRVSSMTSTKTKAPSGLALQQKKMENQQHRKGTTLHTSNSGSNSSSSSNTAFIKQSVPPARAALATVTRVPMPAPATILTISKQTPGGTPSTSSPTQHRRSRSSGNLMTSPTLSPSTDASHGANYISSPYAASKGASSSSSRYGYSITASSSLSSPSSSALLRSKTPPPRRLDDYTNYKTTGGYLDYQQNALTPTRYIKT